jgi:AraC-like DNA-binding protein
MNVSEWVDNPRSTKSGYSIHTITANKSWSFPEHGHRGFHELVCCLSGTFKNIANGREIAQAPGAIVLIRDRDSHALSGQGFSYVNLMFQTDWLGRLEHYTQFIGTADALMTPADPPRAAIPPPQQAQYRADLDALLANADSIGGRRLFAAFLLGTVIQHLAPPTGRELPAGLPDWLRSSIVWMDEHRHAPPTVKEVVAHSGRCHEHFTREFTRHMGLTPSLHLTNLRIDRAAEMLITSNNKITDICEKAGFENESYFYRVFSQRKRMTPQAYRRAFGPRSIQRPAAGAKGS